MAARLDYGKLAPEGLAKMRALEHYLNTEAGLEPTLVELVRLRVSEMNGCEYCVGLHTGALQRQNETAERIGEVVDWRGSEVYTQRERAALGLGRCADRHPGGARSGCGVRRGAGALFRGGDGEPDAGDYDDQCMEPDRDWAGSARGAAVTCV